MDCCTVLNSVCIGLLVLILRRVKRQKRAKRAPGVLGSGPRPRVE